MSAAKASSPIVVYEGYLLCDDVRMENNGKLMFLGVYSDIVQVAKLPATLRSLGVVIKARIMAAGRMTFVAALMDPQGNELFRGGGELNYDGEVGHIIWMPVVVGPAMLPIEGTYTISITLGDGSPVHEAFHVLRAAVPTVQQIPATPN